MGSIGRRTSEVLKARSPFGLKPQDVLVVLKMLVSGDKDWRLVDLGQELGLSQTEVSFALARAQRSGLVDASKRRPNRTALEEFLIHGLKYVFPAELGAVCRGLPTSHSMTPLSKEIVSEPHDQYVWPYADGKMRGQSVTPLYPSAPYAASRDPKLHEFLALIDALRVGRARERNLAAEGIKKRLHAPKE
jgi:hypothetical protein